MPRLTLKADGEAILNRWANKIEQEQQKLLKQLAGLHKSLEEVKKQQVPVSTVIHTNTVVDNGGGTVITPKVPVPALTGLTLVSNLTTAVVGQDGIAQPRILASWAQSVDPAVVANGQIVVSIENVTDALDWAVYGSYPGNTTFVYISGVTAGKNYNVRVVAQRATGEFSTATTEGPHTVVTYPPATPVPDAPVIATQLLAQPLVLQFSFNPVASTDTCPVTGYQVYKNSINDASTASAWRPYPQTLAPTTVQDTVGAGVVAYYWVTAVGPTGESTKTPAQLGAVAALPANNVMTTYRPSAYTNGAHGFTFPTYGYDNNLNNAAIGASNANTFSVSCVWKSIPNATGTPTSVILKIDATAYLDDLEGGFGTASIEVSLNSGSTYTLTHSMSDGESGIVSFTLGNSQSLNTVWIRGTVAGSNTVSETKQGSSLLIREIWVEVTT